MIDGTNGKMYDVYLVGSGSEAVETAMKLAYSYHLSNNQPQRINFIARKGSYHGATLGSLSVSGHFARREPYKSLLIPNIHFVSPCYPYRLKKEYESNEAYVAKLITELEEKILELGPDTVGAFIFEPVVGAALGCVPYVPGYLEAMKKVCHKYEVIFIMDEIMCGSGRTGYLHAWQEENVVPDIQTLAKGLGGGYVSIAALMSTKKVNNMIHKGQGEFIHGHTYEARPTDVAGAFEVQKIIRENNLPENVKKLGKLLETLLIKELSGHPNVGDIRGKGLFLGIELVEDKETKKPFNPELKVAKNLADLAFSPKFNMTMYHGTGTVDGINGDHIMLCPPFIITEKHVVRIVKVVSKVINLVCSQIPSKKR